MTCIHTKYSRKEECFHYQLFLRALPISVQIYTADDNLAVGYLQEDVNEGHPREEGFRIQIRTTAFPGVHLRKKVVPLRDELKRKVELTPSNQAFIIYTPIASVRTRPSPAFFLRHGRPAGATVIFTFAVG